MPTPQRNEAGGEVPQFGVDRRPVPPCDVAVLAVGIVVALLGPAELVTTEQQRHSTGQQQGGQHGPPLPGPQCGDDRVGGRTLDAAVPRPVVAGAVPVVLGVRLVVLVVVGDQVPQGCLLYT